MIAPAPPVVVPAGVEAAVLDPDRLAAVLATRLLDTAPTAPCDELTKLASRLLDAPMSFLTLVDESRSFWLSSTGVEGVRENSVETSFCQYVIADRSPLFVADATVNPRTRENPSVEGMGVRAWAGFPVVDVDGTPLGSFCVMDTVPREWTPEQKDLLQALARAASAQVQVLTAGAQRERDQVVLDALRDRERAAAARLQRLAGVALSLSTAESVDDLVEILIDQGAPVLGAAGGALVVREGDRLRVSLSRTMGSQVRADYALLPLDNPLPGPVCVATGRRVVVSNRAEGLALSPDMAQVHELTGHLAHVAVPLTTGGRVFGSLVVGWEEEQDFDAETLEMLEAFGAQCAQGLERIITQEAVRDANLTVARMSESLQRSLLTRPATSEDVDLATRYLPAVAEVRIGGDWHDAFVTTSGAMLLSVGDVAGHDRGAAAAMAQIRNLLRGMAVDSDDSPAALLARLDRAIAALEVGTLATALLLRMEPGDGSGVRRVRWSSAGHPPPALLLPDGTVALMRAEADLLLGLDACTDRAEHVTELPDGATLVLYTDGLTERRGEDLDVGLDRLTAALGLCGGLDADATCEELLTRMLPEDPCDDVALLVLRAGVVGVTPAAGAGPGRDDARG